MTNKTDRTIRDLIERGKRARDKLARQRRTSELGARARSRGLRIRCHGGGCMLTDGNGRVLAGFCREDDLDNIAAFLG